MKTLTVMGFAIFLGVAGCEQRERKVAVEPDVDEPARRSIDTETKTQTLPRTQPEAQPRADRDIASESDFERARRNFIDESRERIDALDAKLAELRRRADDLSGDAERATREAIDDLEDERDDLDESLDRARNRSKEEWRDAENQVERGLDALERAYEDVVDRLRS